MVVSLDDCPHNFRVMLHLDEVLEDPSATPEEKARLVEMQDLLQFSFVSSIAHQDEPILGMARKEVDIDDEAGIYLVVYPDQVRHVISPKDATVQAGKILCSLCHELDAIKIPSHHYTTSRSSSIDAHQRCQAVIGKV